MVDRMLASEAPGVQLGVASLGQIWLNVFFNEKYDDRCVSRKLGIPHDSPKLLDSVTNTGHFDGFRGSRYWKT